MNMSNFPRTKTGGVGIAVVTSAALAICLVVAAWSSHPAQGTGDRKVRIAAEQALPQLDATKLKATLVEVTYAPGAASAPHSHPCPVIGYVVSGELRTQVKGG